MKSDTFQRWFSGSQVVDELGRPLIVYHGTTKSFDEFRVGDEGIFFAESPDTAAFYAKGDEGHLISVHLSIRNPLRMSWREWLRGVTDKGLNHYLEGNEGLSLLGYDGIILTEPDLADPAASSVTYVVFGPDQIRLARNAPKRTFPRLNSLADDGFTP